MEPRHRSSREATSDLFEALHTQRAIRRFRPDPVPLDLLWQVLEAATKAPSGKNLQPWGFVVVSEAERRAAILNMMKGWLVGDATYQNYLATADEIADSSRRRIAGDARQFFEDLGGVPVLIIPCLHNVTSPRSNGVLAGSSIYPAVQNLLLAARGLGLGTALTTFQVHFADSLRDLLKLPDDTTPVALVPLGFPDSNFGPTIRKPVEQVVHWEEWGIHRPR